MYLTYFNSQYFLYYQNNRNFVLTTYRYALKSLTITIHATENSNKGCIYLGIGIRIVNGYYATFRGVSFSAFLLA